MKTDIATRWTAALRSGTYQQGTGALRRGGEFCCLGVLCELAIQDGLPVETETSGSGVLYDGQEGLLPSGVRTWAGLESSDGMLLVDVRDPDHGSSLATRNDEGLSFEEIADIIERHAADL